MIKKDNLTKNKIVEDNAFNAICQCMYRHTVVIDISIASSKCPDYGTGVLIENNSRKFVLTCEHVVKKEYDINDLRFIPKGNLPLKLLDKEEIKNKPIYQLGKNAHVRPLPAINKFYSLKHTDDLVLIEMDMSSDDTAKCNFISILTENMPLPTTGRECFLLGYSQELLRRNTQQKSIAYSPYALGAIIIQRNVSISDFIPQDHFLIEFPSDERSVDPHGLSGAGVWAILNSPGDSIWSPNICLLGVQTSVLQTGVHKQNSCLIATKIERVLEILRRVTIDVSKSNRINNT